MKKVGLILADLPLLCIAILMSLSTFSGVFRLPGIIYIFLVGFFFLFYVLLGHNKRRLGSGEIWLFVFICVLSIIINNPATYFRSWERLAIFVLTLLAFSPMIIRNDINYKRYKLFVSLLKIMLLFSIASFIGYFFGINFFIRDGITLDYHDAGHFSGFVDHSMVLAPVSALSSLYCFFMFLKNYPVAKKTIIWGAAFICCMGALLLSASRGALLGICFALVIMLFRYSSGKLIITIKYTFLVLSVVLITFPAWRGLTSSVMEKIEYNESQGGIMYSRETKMAARVYEIKNNFFTGVGFATVDETVDYVDRSSGTIEPNSSWLGVFSMTGVFGFVVFLVVFILSLINALKRILDKYQSSLMAGILSFFFIHMMIEGYVLAGGNFLCGFYWLSLGVTYGLSDNKIKCKEVKEAAANGFNE